jgi:general stress protein YciG
MDSTNAHTSTTIIPANIPANLDQSPRPKARRGFAAMDPDKVKAIAQKGGVAVHAKGTAHRFSKDQAREAGRKGGMAPHRARGRSPISETMVIAQPLAEDDARQAS